MRKLEPTLSQNTVADHIVIQGTGLHSGADAILRIHPAKADNGIIFMRSDVSDRNNLVPALWDHVVDTKLCTVIGNKDGVSIGTIEHLMAALNAMNITNAMIELDGPEVPIMDGSSLPFITAIKKVGISAQNAPQKAIKILEEITFKEDDKFVTLSPSEFAEFSITIDFDHKSIGKQSFAMRLDADNFAKDISDARTFGFLHEFNHLRSLGLCLGGTLENAVALDGDKVLNPEGLRHDDEFARHKLLDAVGDIYLAGHRIIGTYKGYKSGHAVNNQALRALFANPDKWALVDMKNTAFNIKEVAA
jgi:UDP-3-O-[3-hydroxymyristoyl] N-acetylglucosamine deacetylase